MAKHLNTVLGIDPESSIAFAVVISRQGILSLKQSLKWIFKVKNGTEVLKMENYCTPGL